MDRNRIHEIIFEADTREGKVFDVTLLIAILLSVLGVILTSVKWIEHEYGDFLRLVEWFFTILFTIEYFLRIYSINKPWKYIFSFMGIIDLLSIIPTYLVFLYPPMWVLIDIRIIRLIRIFRVFKLSRYLRGANVMQIALRSSQPKIIVFLLSISLIVVVLGTLMYIVEGQKNGFENIPKSIYWAVVTLTTVGYGDVVPVTAFGQFLASVIMILGYGIIAVPTGIVSASMVNATQNKVSTQACRDCAKEGHEIDAIHCKFCGSVLND
ncbi:MAG: ion transporter [Flavobacteriales bacterium]